MKLDIERIKKNLDTQFLGNNIIYIEQIDSTQDECKRRIANISNGTYIVTDKQVSGKGTHGRIWYDNGYENICGSFILTPNCEIRKLDRLTVLIAECLVATIKELFNIECDIKYPNDILLNSKKIAGILTESTTSNEIAKSVIIGIGINVNQTDFAPEIENIATSLKKEYGKEFCREDIIAKFFNIFEGMYTKLI